MATCSPLARIALARFAASGQPVRAQPILHEPPSFITNTPIVGLIRQEPKRLALLASLIKSRPDEGTLRTS